MISFYIKNERYEGKRREENGEYDALYGIVGNESAVKFNFIHGDSSYFGRNHRDNRTGDFVHAQA